MLRGLTAGKAGLRLLVSPPRPRGTGWRSLSFSFLSPPGCGMGAPTRRANARAPPQRQHCLTKSLWHLIPPPSYRQAWALGTWRSASGGRARPLAPSRTPPSARTTASCLRCPRVFHLSLFLSYLGSLLSRLAT